MLIQILGRGNAETPKNDGPVTSPLARLRGYRPLIPGPHHLTHAITVGWYGIDPFAAGVCDLDCPRLAWLDPSNRSTMGPPLRFRDSYLSWGRGNASINAGGLQICGET
jgi:hypothetical protein